ncbi:MAG TPA: hypothetical protein PLR18_00125 [bacterium]|nr:hypothetical protein [bacterium]
MKKLILLTCILVLAAMSPPQSLAMSAQTMDEAITSTGPSVSPPVSNNSVLQNANMTQGQTVANVANLEQMTVLMVISPPVVSNDANYIVENANEAQNQQSANNVAKSEMMTASADLSPTIGMVMKFTIVAIADEFCNTTNPVAIDRMVCLRV